MENRLYLSRLTSSSIARCVVSRPIQKPVESGWGVGCCVERTTFRGCVTASPASLTFFGLPLRLGPGVQGSGCSGCSRCCSVSDNQYFWRQ